MCSAATLPGCWHGNCKVNWERRRCHQMGIKPICYSHLTLTISSSLPGSVTGSSPKKTTFFLPSSPLPYDRASHLHLVIIINPNRNFRAFFAPAVVPSAKLAIMFM